MTDKKPLIELEDKEPDVRIPINFRPEQEKELKLYCQYAGGSSIHHVVRAAVRRLFAQDKGFQDFKEQNQEVATLPAAEPKPKRSRKGAAADAQAAQSHVA
jgi:hypothetical protein